LNFEYYIAKRITFQSKRTFSKIIVRFAITAIALSIAVMLVSVSILKGFQNEIKNKVIGFTSHIQISHINLNYTYENEAIEFDQEIYDNILELEEVEQVNIFATKPGIIKTKEDIEGIVLKGVDEDYNFNNISKYLKEGEIPEYKENEISNDVLISETLAKLLKLKIGDNIEIYFVQKPPRARKLTICGIYHTGLEEIDKTYAICDIQHIQRLNKWEENQISGYEIKLYDIKQLNYANDIVRIMVPIEQDSKTIYDIYPQILDWLGVLDKNVQIILILMLIVAAVNMITALLIIILEKTHMIGIFKAFGSSNNKISKIFLYNASFLIVYGLLIGNILGIGLMTLQYYTEFFKLPEEYLFMESVPILFTWGNFAIINLGTFIFCSLIMLLPSFFVSRIDPVKSIRFE